MDIPTLPKPPAQDLSTQSPEDILSTLGINDIPFTEKLSLEPLLKHIDHLQKSKDRGEAFLAKAIMQRVEKTPELLLPIEEEKILEKHKEVLELLMLFVFPPALRETTLAKVVRPFGITSLYETPKLQKLWKENRAEYTINKDSNIFYCNSTIRACTFILNKFYGQNIEIESPMLLSVREIDCPIQRHFRTQLNLDYIDIKKTKPLKPLTQEQINHLLSNIYDIDLWLQYLPPENFEFHGLAIGQMIDITEVEALSRIKYALLERDAVVNPASIEALQDLVRTYINMPDLRLGITAIDYPVENSIAHKYKIRFDFLANTQEKLLAKANANSIYEKACRYKEVLLVEDLEELTTHTPIERELLANNIRSIIVAPLFNKDKQVIGLLEIGSARPYAMHSFVELQFKELISLFSIAVERSREEIDNRIEATIREQYTAVHPSVGWKFVETTYNLLEQREKDPANAVPAPIIFKDVYPLYGQADIVSSSIKRNTAIQADLLDNLNRVERILEAASSQMDFPLANKYLVKVRRDKKNLQEEFNSNDESRIVEMLHEEIHPLLEELHRQEAELASPISAYFSYIDPELAIVYRERKDYEESVSAINNAISNYLQQQQQKAQKVLPHYFEKYKTDGVEYDIYIGQSLLNKHQFNMMHLHNLRLWQLIDMCEITRKVEQLGATLPVPLQTAQLIFVYNTPLSIRFRMDEKQFDVDGAYNVRYEILKKRIDKATIEGTDERLTVAGKVAIVYLNEKERQEYLEYIDYLKAENYITEVVEDLTLGKLQGVQGLRALRITVATEMK